MDKNIIKNHLNARFLTEDSTPGIDVTKKVNKESGKINKAGLKAVEKDALNYDKSSKKDEVTNNKFNYNGAKEKEYHDEMEILNGQEMIEYDREPNSQFKERAKEAIEGSTRMGNKGGKDVGNAEATWGASNDNFGKELVKRAAASSKKRLEAQTGIMSFGDDIETIPKGTKPMAKHSAYNENTTPKKVVKENLGNQGISEKTQNLITSWVQELGARQTGVKLIDTVLARATGGMTSSDLTDSTTFANGLDEIEQYLEANELGNALDAVKETARDMLEDEGFPMHENIHNTAQMGGITKSNGVGGINDTSKMDKDYADSVKNNPANKENNNKPQIKEGMKRLNFKKEFNGVGNALKMIPESYKVENKVFEMTDGNESFKIRWEGTLSEGRAVILAASNKTMVNEDMQKMKHLMGYKSESTLGLVKGNARLDENAIFNDIYAKTKALLEGEDIESQKAPIVKDASKSVSVAPEAKKDIEGSTSDDKGTKAPKAKTGSMESFDDAKKQAPEAKKHVEGSVSAEIGMGLGDQSEGEGEWDQISIPQAAAHGNPSSTTYAPAPSTGEWDKIAVPQASDAKKHVHMGEGVELGGIIFEPINEEFVEEEEIDENDEITEEEEVVEEVIEETEDIDETEE